MIAYAAVLTGKGLGAIATIQVYGPNAFYVICDCCRPISGPPFKAKIGQFRLAHIYQAERPIDQVLIACEDQDLWAIHCHGNPLIVQTVMELLKSYGIEPIQPRSLLAKYHLAKGQDAIQIEARLALLDAASIDAARLIAKQASGGLHARVKAWQAMSLDKVQVEARKLLASAQAARRYLYGCTIAIVGPTNSGKSSIFNSLLGQQRAVVSDQPVTTRDPVRSSLQIGPLHAELLDTAPLCPRPADPLHLAAYDLTCKTLQTTDLALLVLDGTVEIRQLEDLPKGLFHSNNLITIINKSDLPAVLDPSSLPRWLGKPIRTSATTGQGIDILRQALIERIGLSAIRPDRPVVFTERQRQLISRLVQIPSHDQLQAQQILMQLLSGPHEY